MNSLESSGRVAVVTRWLEGGGAERVALNLVNDYVRRGLEVDLVLQYKRGPYMLSLDPRVNVVVLNRRVRYALPRLLAYLRRRRPAALLSVLTEPNVLSIIAWRLSGLEGRVVVSEQTSMVGAGVSRKLAISLVYRLADAVVACAEALSGELNRLRVPQSLLRVIPNPVSDGAAQHSVVRTPDESAHIVATGRLDPQKDFPTLIRAFEILRRTREARLSILGEGPERSRLEDLIEDLELQEHVDLPGFLSPPWKVMSSASVFVLSSRYEGWPNVLVEALALGVPVVATDCPTGPSEILENGRFGRLVPIGDVQRMANAIAATLDDPPPRELLRRRSEEWTVGAIGKQYLTELGLGAEALTVTMD